MREPIQAAYCLALATDQSAASYWTTVAAIFSSAGRFEEAFGSASRAMELDHEGLGGRVREARALPTPKQDPHPHAVARLGQLDSGDRSALAHLEYLP